MTESPHRPRVHVYEDTRGEWRWKLVATNGRIIADSAEGYGDKHEAQAAVHRVTAAFRDHDVTIDD